MGECRCRRRDGSRGAVDNPLVPCVRMSGAFLAEREQRGNSFSSWSVRGEVRGETIWGGTPHSSSGDEREVSIGMRRVAIMGTMDLPRRSFPYTPFDGDTFFCVSSARSPVTSSGGTLGNLWSRGYTTREPRCVGLMVCRRRDIASGLCLISNGVCRPCGLFAGDRLFCGCSASDCKSNGTFFQVGEALFKNPRGCVECVRCSADDHLSRDRELPRIWRRNRT